MVFQNCMSFLDKYKEMPIVDERIINIFFFFQNVRNVFTTLSLKDGERRSQSNWSNISVYGDIIHLILFDHL